MKMAKNNMMVDVTVRNPLTDDNIRHSFVVANID